MGKVRRKKNHGDAARAAVDSKTAVSAKDIQLPTVAQNRTTMMTDMQAGVLDGLTSLNALTRESSCAAISSLFEKIDSPEARSEAWVVAQRLIAGGVVRKLLPRLVDRVPDVKLQAAGAMRNISAVRDPRVCEIMVNDDCLTPVLTLLDRMSSTTGAFSTAAVAASVVKPGNSVDSKVSQAMTPEQEQTVMTQLVATLCNLLAAVDVAVRRFTTQGGLKVVIGLLPAQGCRGNAEIFGGALQVLHVATDCNPELVRQLAELPGAVDQLAGLVAGHDLAHVSVSPSMRLQAAGVLVNAAGCSSGDRRAENEAELNRVVLALLLEQMRYDPATLERACSDLANSPEGAAGEGMDVDGEVKTDANGGAPSSSNDDAVDRIGEMETEDSLDKSVAVSSAAVADAMPMQITTQQPVEQNGAPVPGKTDRCPRKGKGQRDRDAEIRWEWKLAIAEPLKLAAEVLANVCALAAEDDEGQDEGDKEWDSDDEDAMERAACSGGGSQEGMTTPSPMTTAGGRSGALLDALTDRGALRQTTTALRSLLSPTPRDRPPDDASRLALPSGTASDLADLRAIVALCAANLVQNLPDRALGSDPQLLWWELCDMCEIAVERAPSCVETMTGIMWGLVRRTGPAVAAALRSGAKERSAGLPPLLLRLCDPEKTRSFEARVNAVGMLGALGAAALDSPVGSGEEWDLVLGRALVQTMDDPHVLVQAEALNALMDVYGDDKRDVAFCSCGVPAALTSGVPAFRRKVKQEGKALGRDALCHLKETALNAARFVKYKVATAKIGAGCR